MSGLKSVVKQRQIFCPSQSSQVSRSGPTVALLSGRAVWLVCSRCNVFLILAENSRSHSGECEKAFGMLHRDRRWRCLLPQSSGFVWYDRMWRQHWDLTLPVACMTCAFSRYFFILYFPLPQCASPPSYHGPFESSLVQLITPLRSLLILFDNELFFSSFLSSLVSLFSTFERSLSSVITLYRSLFPLHLCFLSVVCTWQSELELAGVPT